MLTTIIIVFAIRYSCNLIFLSIFCYLKLFYYENSVMNSDPFQKPLGMASSVLEGSMMGTGVSMAGLWYGGAEKPGKERLQFSQGLHRKCCMSTEGWERTSKAGENQGPLGGAADIEMNLEYLLFLTSPEDIY